MRMGRLAQAATAHGGVQVLRVVSGLAVVPIQLRLLDESGFAALTLLLSMPVWLAGLDLGLSGYLRTLVAGGTSVESSVAATRGALSVSARSAAALAVIGLPLAVLGVSWAVSSDPVPGVGVATAIYWVLFCASLPLTVGFSALEAFGRTTSTAVMNGMAPVLVLAGTLIASVLDLGLPAIAAVSALGMLAPRLIATVWLHRHMAGASSVGRTASRHVLRSAAPFIVPAALWGLAFGLDPIILSIFGTVGDVAAFGVVARLYALVIAVPSALVTTMWVAFAAVRGSQSHNEWWAHGWRSIKNAALVGCACGLVFATCTPPFVRMWLGDDTSQVVALAVAFGLLIAVQIGTQPVTALLTRPDEMRQQSRTLIAMCVLNVLFSIALVPQLHAAGPVVASAVCLLLIHRLPAIVRFRRLRDEALTPSTSG